MMEKLSVYLHNIDWNLLLHKGIYILVVLVLAFAAMRVLKLALRRFEQALIKAAEVAHENTTEACKRIQTLSTLLRQAAVVTIWLVTLFTVLSELGVDIGPILAGAGIVGLAVGFGAQNLVRDVISGFFLILEDQVRVGDVAIVNGTGGLVENVRLRTLVLRDLAGVVHVFPNGTINTLSNMTKGWSAYVFEVPIAYKENPDKAMEVMRRIANDMRQDSYFSEKIIADLEVFGVDKWDDSAVVIKARFKTQPIAQWEVGREYWKRLKHAFDQESIEIPFPHLSVYVGAQSKPLSVLLNDAKSPP